MRKSLIAKFGASGVALWIIFWVLWELFKDAIFGWLNSLLVERWDVIETTIQQAFPTLTTIVPAVVLGLVAIGVVWVVYNIGRGERDLKRLAAGAAIQHPVIHHKSARTRLTELGIPVTQAELFERIKVLDMGGFSLLIEAGIPIDSKKGREGKTPLIVSCEDGHLLFAQKCIDQNADVNTKDNNGITALMYVCAKQHVGIVRILLEANADVNLRSPRGATATMPAAAKGSLDILDALVRRGADLNICNNKGENIIMMAALTKEKEIVKYLIDQKVKVNAHTNDDACVIDYAAASGELDEQMEMIELLEQAGAKWPDRIKRPDSYGSGLEGVSVDKWIPPVQQLKGYGEELKNEQVIISSFEEIGKAKVFPVQGFIPHSSEIICDPAEFFVGDLITSQAARVWRIGNGHPPLDQKVTIIARYWNVAIR